MLPIGGPTTLTATRGIIPVNNGSGSIVVTNTGATNPALNVHAVLPGAWTDVSQNSSNCTSISPTNTCTLTFTGTAPHIAQGITITADNISGSTSSAIAFSIEGYLVYAFSGSIAHVMGSEDAANPGLWSQYPNLLIPGITETSTVAGGDACNGATDGLCDTGQIEAFYTTPYSNYAAGVCFEITTDNTGTVAMGTWYLPAICEMNGKNGFVNCTGSSNINTLSLLGFGGLQPSPAYWSSTESSESSNTYAFSLQYEFGGIQVQADRQQSNGIRCVRTIPF